ncbi:hemin uptake protein HemP [Thalassococcus profundi]|jgi:hemin uptake protein HemP|uniref:Hemin uptake protein HemP n=1 Tax=Thalassococcus profundi TaxID=2282382 RepID=A0A369TI14_9RHOB|nr:hemin uptake protein HemP [Thalassococcus profundi]RDD64918.1 hemin uptake protein HemP [Thalassococcus profundi]
MSLMQNLPTPASVDRSDDTATFDARELIRNGVKAEIVLDGQTYTLRITRAGKLILTK